MSEESGIETHEFDVLVIGAGGAGLRAAIEASSKGSKTAIVCKSLLGKAHTVMAEGGIAAALGNADDRDNWKVHFKDTMLGGNFANNYLMAEIHAKESPERVKELLHWGALFDRTRQGEVSQRNFGGHEYPRLAHVGDRTGLEMIRTLQDKGVHSGIDVLMECTITRLLKDGDAISGALGYYRSTGKFVLFKCKAIVLATGGIGKCFSVNSNSWEYTGDGHALAYSAGADLIDMEFIQFHPTGMVAPHSVRGILVTEGVRGEGGVLRNTEGKRFMFDYIPEKYKKLYADSEEEANKWLEETIAGKKPTARKPPELMSRDVVARAIWGELEAGRGTEHGGVFLDIASVRSAEDIMKKLPSMHHQFKELADVDITKVPMEVGPTCHYVMGGVRVDPGTQMSTVPGLFAAGEVACGLHGSNRLGGNSLSDLVVFGRRAGLHASEYARKVKRTPKVNDAEVGSLVKEMLHPFTRESGLNPYDLTKELQAAMDAGANMIREEQGMKTCLKKIHGIKDKVSKIKVMGDRRYNPGWNQAIDLRSLLIVAEAVVTSALARKESRGAHTRIDFPEYSKRYSKDTMVVRKFGGTMKGLTAPLPQMPTELEELFDPIVLKKLRGEK